MTYNFILIGDKKSKWKDQLREAVSPLGELKTLTEKDARAHAHTSKYEVIIVDESGVKRVEELVARFSSQLDPPPVIVVYASEPRWETTLKLFKAGATDYIPKFRDKYRLASFFKELIAGPVSA